MLNPIKLNKFNQEISYAIHESAFGNAFYIFHKFFDTFSSKEVKVLSTPTVKLMNANFLFGFEVKIEGIE
jgi:hypothetical protein